MLFAQASSHLLYYVHVPLLLILISLVYSATRFDDWHLILREAFYGTTRFDDFAQRVGISEPVTAARRPAPAAQTPGETQNVHYGRLEAGPRRQRRSPQKDAGFPWEWWKQRRLWRREPAHGRRVPRWRLPGRRRRRHGRQKASG